MKKILVKRKIMTFEEMKKAFPDAEEIITLDSLLKDNCKLAKELWGEEIVTMTDYLFGNEFKFLAFQYHLNQIADLISKGGSIQEYIDKTKI